MMSSQGTLIQRWNKWCTLTAALALLTAHIAAFVVAAHLCPQLFSARSYEGRHCQLRGDEESFDLALTGCPEQLEEEEEEEESVCPARDTGDIVRLEDIRLSFTFPRLSEGEGEEEMLSSWSWRLVGSLALTFNILDQNFSLASPDLLLSASLDYAPVRLLRGLKEREEGGECFPSSPWHSRARLVGAERSLSCSQSPPDTQNYHCTLHPFLELLVLSNSSYALQVRLSGQDSSELLAANVTVSSALTVVRETDSFHRIYFYLKCLFTPLVLLGLVWFMVRLWVIRFRMVWLRMVTLA